MPQSQHTVEEQQRLCLEARRLLRKETPFPQVCLTLGVKPPTLRRWLNDQMLERIYPPVPNVGRI